MRAGGGGGGERRRTGVAVQEGAANCLRREYTFIAGFGVVVTVVLAVFIDYDVLDKLGPDGGRFGDLPRTAGAYLLGAVASAAAGPPVEMAVPAPAPGAASPSEDDPHAAIRTAIANSKTPMVLDLRLIR